MAQESIVFQPNEFRSAVIAIELRAEGESEYWKGLFVRSRRREAIPVPFWGERVVECPRLFLEI